MLCRSRTPLLAVITFALAACSDPAGPRQTPDSGSASALRMGAYGGGVKNQINGSADRAAAQGGKLGASTNPVEDAAGGIGAQGGAGKGTLTPVEDGAEGIGVQGTKLGTTGGGDGNQ